MRNETQEVSRHHGGESSVGIERQQSAADTVSRKKVPVLLLFATIVMFVKAEWIGVGPLAMGGLGMLPVYWLIMSVATLGARDALRRAMNQNVFEDIADPLKLSARELASLQGLTRAAMWLAGIMSVLLMGAVSVWVFVLGQPFLPVTFQEEFQISSVVFVWLLGVAALWVLLEIALEYLCKVGDGRFAVGLELVVAVVFGVITIVPVLGSGGIALIGVSAAFLIGWIIALVRMRRVKPWMPANRRKELLPETPWALLGLLLYLLFVLLNGAEAHRFSWDGYIGVMGFYYLVVIPAVLGLLMLEIAKPARRLDRERTALLVAGVSAFLLLIGMMALGMRYGVLHSVDPIGAMYRFQFFFAAAFALIVLYAKQNFRMILAEVVLFFGISFTLRTVDTVEMTLNCLAYAVLFALLCLPEWVRALKRLGKWLKTI